MNWSSNQINIFDAFKNTKSDLAISATAGSGKSTTLLELLKFVPKFRKAIFLSFSNAIVKELKDRVPSGVRASTLHSLGYGAILSIFKEVTLDENKYFILALNAFYQEEDKRKKETLRDCFRIQTICNFIRMTFCNQDKDTVEEMCLYYGLDFTSQLIEYSLKLVKNRENIKVIDFTDMIYLPVADSRIILPKFHYVFVDEAQDLNNCQKELIYKILTDDGRLISVGDSWQSIYSFSGSSIESFQELQARPNTLVLPLDVTYRCPKAIAYHAQAVNPNIKPYENNPEGIVRVGKDEEIREGDLVVCRNTRPLISLFFFLTDNDIKANLVGKDIEKGLTRLAKHCSSESLHIFHQNLEKELLRLYQELYDLGVQEKNINSTDSYTALLEKTQVLRMISKKVGSGGEVLIRKIKEIFNEDKKAAKLMTIHRSKGLENDRVFIVDTFNGEKLLPSKYAEQDWEKLQEKNLDFVARTRAKKELIYIDIVSYE